MANVSGFELPKEQRDELCLSYAALMLHDEGLDITAEKLSKIIKESGNEVEPMMPKLFANSLKHHDIGNLLSQLGGEMCYNKGVSLSESTPSSANDFSVHDGYEREDEFGEVMMNGLHYDPNDEDLY